MAFKELTYKNDKLRLKEGRVNKNYSLDKINCRRDPNAKEDLEPFILPFDILFINVLLKKLNNLSWIHLFHLQNFQFLILIKS